MAYEFRPIEYTDERLSEVSALLNRTMTFATHLSTDFLRWQYRDNPSGPAIGFNAYHNDKLVSHYALLPTSCRYQNQKLTAVLSVNTATDAEHRGPAMLFPRLARMSFKQAEENGIAVAIGVSNSLSTRGFTALGFRIVCQLEAQFGLGLPVYKPKTSEPDFQICWDSSSIEWRVGSPRYLNSFGKSEIRKQGDWLLSKGPKIGTRSLLGKLSSSLEVAPLPKPRLVLPNLYLGLDPNIDWKTSSYFSIPMKLRPSPLNFIVLNLDKKERHFDPAKMQVQAIDLDIL